MNILERKEWYHKVLKDAAGVSNSDCVMPLYTYRWRQLAVCEDKKPLQEIIDRLPEERRRNYRITSNDGGDNEY